MAIESVRIAAVGDVHCSTESAGAFQSLFAHVADNADVLLLVGDLTNFGTPDEARVLAREIAPAGRMPILAVLGNHDVESDTAPELVKILGDAGVVFLDGATREIHGIGFAGVKGFCGGFGRRSLAPWGERIVKQFVDETIQEALRLEKAMAQLRTDQKVVLLHYAPIHATCVGEPEEIIPFLGSTRLEDPIDRYRATMVFHGHAHHGTHEGRTKGGVPVYNVAMKVMRALDPASPPVKIIEVPVTVERDESHDDRVASWRDSNRAS